MIKSETIGMVAAAFVKAQAAMGNAVKGANNPFFKSKYTDLNAIREAALPALKEHGLSISQPTTYIDGKKFVETILLHESGEYIGGLTEILAVKETDAQAQGSGISYARRYGLQSLLCIGSEDDDGNSASGKNEASSPIKKTFDKSSKKDGETVAETSTPAIGSSEPSVDASTKESRSFKRSFTRNNK